MPRGVSTRLLCTLPDSYSADFVSRLDKRTTVARAVLARIAELESDAGGADALSSARRSLIRHAAWLDAVVESQELRLAEGQELDVSAYTQSLNSLLGLYRLLGLERRQRPARTLAEIMGHGDGRRREPVASDASPAAQDVQGDVPGSEQYSEAGEPIAAPGASEAAT